MILFIVVVLGQRVERQKWGESESGSAEGSASGGESPEGARSTDVGRCPAEAGPTAVQEAVLRDGGLRNFGKTGHRDVAVPAEVGPERDQPDQPGRAGEMVYTLAVEARNPASRESTGREEIIKAV